MQLQLASHWQLVGGVGGLSLPPPLLLFIQSLLLWRPLGKLGHELHPAVV